MGLTIEEAYGILSNGLVNAPSEHEWCMAFKFAIETMRKYQKIINDYEILADSLEKSGASPKVCSKKIDKFCIDTMKEILCDYYADVLQKEIEDGNKD